MHPSRLSDLQTDFVSQNETSLPAPNFQLLRLMERTASTEEPIGILLVSQKSSWRLQRSALKNHRRRPQIKGKDSGCELIEEWILQQKQFVTSTSKEQRAKLGAFLQLQL